MKKKILGTSDAWLTSHLSHRPSEPAYYIVDCQIFCVKLFQNHAEFSKKLSQDFLLFVCFKLHNTIELIYHLAFLRLCISAALVIIVTVLYKQCNTPFLLPTKVLFFSFYVFFFPVANSCVSVKKINMKGRQQPVAQRRGLTKNTTELFDIHFIQSKL